MAGDGWPWVMQALAPPFRLEPMACVLHPASPRKGGNFLGEGLPSQADSGHPRLPQWSFALACLVWHFGVFWSLVRQQIWREWPPQTPNRHSRSHAPKPCVAPAPGRWMMAWPWILAPLTSTESAAFLLCLRASPPGCHPLCLASLFHPASA